MSNEPNDHKTPTELQLQDLANERAARAILKKMPETQPSKQEQKIMSLRKYNRPRQS